MRLFNTLLINSLSLDELINANNSHEVQKFIDLTKIAILFSTTANGVSQLFFLWALICLFFRHYQWSHELNWSWWKKWKLYCCCTRDEVDDKSLPLDPFNNDHKNEFIEPSSVAVVYQHKLEQVIILDEPTQQERNQKGNFFSQQDTSTSTLLQGERLCHYNTWFTIGLVMILGICSIFFPFQYYINQTTINWWELSTTLCYAWSLVRTIVSCFIFSKLMYAIQRKCEEIEMYVYYTNDNINETVETNNKIKEYVKARFESELKIIATEMLTFINSANDNNALKKKMSNKLMNRSELQDEDEDEVYTALDNASNNRSHEINVNEGNHQEKEIKTILKSVEYNDIKEQHFITQDEERRDAQATRYAYAIKELIDERAKANEDCADGKRALALKYLKERDKHFVNTAVATLSWLQLWFLLHWLLHIISTFMVFTVLIDAVALHAKYKLNHIESGVGFHPVEIVFLFMYSLVQCFVLVYPCLRAAGVTRTRQRVIRKISNDAYKFTNLPDDTIPQFIESMKRQKFGFRLRILCAGIPFNLNFAYLSIAFSFAGSVASLVTTVHY